LASLLLGLFLAIFGNCKVLLQKRKFGVKNGTFHPIEIIEGWKNTFGK